MLTCSSCGRESPDDFAFCPTCGGPLAPPDTPHEVRKVVTVVFCDVTGSTALGEQLDPESLRRVMARYFAEMRSALERHGGTVEKFIGDAVMAVFGVPKLHEDDALRAVRAADDMRRALELLNKELERDHGLTLAARIGVNTGDVVAGVDGDTLVTGDAVNVAARLEQAAPPGAVLLGADTMRLVRDAVVVEAVEPLELKGKSAPVEAFQLLEVVPGAAGLARRLDSPMVGRERQLALLRQAFDATVEDRASHLFTVLGTPGVGKSRLIEEFVRELGPDALVLRGRCLPYGEGITFFPVGEVVKEAAGLEDFDDPEEIERKICVILGEDAGALCAQLAQLFGVGVSDGEPEETFRAVRRFLEVVARTAPLVVVFDDVQWGEATFLDLIDHVATWTREAPIFLVCMARPELLDERPVWGGGKLNATTISLDRLSDDDCAELIANLLGRATFPEGARTRILEAAEGTPLFVEEMLSMLIDDGLLAREDGEWVTSGDVSEVAVPATIQAVIAARLDRLGVVERSVIERASVAGQQFHVGTVRALGDRDADDVAEALRDLLRRGLIGPDRSLLAGDDAYRFRHLLIRDAAYAAIPKAVRADLHERFAVWLEAAAGDRIEEQEEILAYHLEQAHRLRAELGPVDDGLALRAAQHLLRSGRRASDRGDEAGAVGLFRRAAELLPVGDPDRALALFEAARAAYSNGVIGEALPLAEASIEAATASGQDAIAWRARIVLANAVVLKDPHALSTEAYRAEMDAAIEVFTELGDDGGIATALTALAEAEWMPCRYETAAAIAERAVGYARRSGDRRLLRRALGIRLGAVDIGPASRSEVAEKLRETTDEVRGGVIDHMLMVIGGNLLAMGGDLPGARHAYDDAEVIAQELGSTFAEAAGWEWRGEHEFLSGQIDTAERAFRKQYGLMDALGDEGHKSYAAASLARTLCHLGRPDEAETWAILARDLAAADDLSTQSFARSALARVASLRGRHDQAVILAREAVAMFADAQVPLMQGTLWMELARVLQAAGDRVGARQAAREGLAFYERKGHEPAVASARGFIAEVEAERPSG